MGREVRGQEDKIRRVYLPNKVGSVMTVWGHRGIPIAATNYAYTPRRRFFFLTDNGMRTPAIFARVNSVLVKSHSLFALRYGLTRKRDWEILIAGSGEIPLWTGQLLYHIDNPRSGPLEAVNLTKPSIRQHFQYQATRMGGLLTDPESIPMSYRFNPDCVPKDKMDAVTLARASFSMSSFLEGDDIQVAEEPAEAFVDEEDDTLDDDAVF